MSRQSHHQLFGKLLFEINQQRSAIEPVGIKLSGTSQRGAQTTPFVPTRRDQVARFNFHVHDIVFFWGDQAGLQSRVPDRVSDLDLDKGIDYKTRRVSNPQKTHFRGESGRT